MSMQLQYLRGLKLRSLVKKRLGTLPADLRDLYEDVYTQKMSLCAEEGLITRTAFRLLLCAQEPLPTGDFITALSAANQENSDISRDDLLDLCFNFLSLDVELDVFRFAHLSVREYLESKSECEPSRNHALMAECCVRYLSTDDVAECFEPVDDEECAVPRSEEEDITHGEIEGSAVLEGYDFPDCRSLHTDGGSLNADDGSLSAHKGSSHADDRSLCDPKIFLNYFHEYACLFWTLHLSSSGEFRSVDPLKAASYDFMIDQQHATSKSFVHWGEKVVENFDGMGGGTYNGWNEDVGHQVLSTISRPADYLFAAIIWDFWDLVEIRLRTSSGGISDAYTCRCRMTALQLVCERGNLKAVSLLIDGGADLEHQSGTEWTALDQKAVTGSLELGLAKLGKFIYPSERNHWGDTTLHLAAGKGHPDVVQLLLKFGAKTRTKDYNGKIALQRAAEEGHEDIIKLLSEHVSMTEVLSGIDGIAAARLHRAANIGNVTTLRLLLDMWPKFATDEVYLGIVLWRAVRNLDVPVVQLLLERAAEVNTIWERTPVIWSLVRFWNRTKSESYREKQVKALKILELLVERGVNVNVAISGQTLLCKAIRHEAHAVVQLLLNHGADVNPQGLGFGRKPLYEAICKSDRASVQLLLQKGADVNVVRERCGSFECFDDGETLLDMARENGMHDIAQILLEHGATSGRKSQDSDSDEEEPNEESEPSE